MRLLIAYFLQSNFFRSIWLVSVRVIKTRWKFSFLLLLGMSVTITIGHTQKRVIKTTVQTRSHHKEINLQSLILNKLNFYCTHICAHVRILYDFITPPHGKLYSYIIWLLSLHYSARQIIAWGYQKILNIPL